MSGAQTPPARLDWAQACVRADAVEPAPTLAVHPQYGAALGVGTWPAGVGGGVGAQVGSAGVIWLEDDAFNSKQFGLHIARLHHRLAAAPDDLGAVVDQLSDAQLVCTRVIGHSYEAMSAFARAGWDLVATNLFFYRPADRVGPDLPVADEFEVRLRDLREEPLTPPELERHLALANPIWFFDRFALDPRIGREAAWRRFGRVTREALEGRLVNRLITTKTPDGELASFVFFNVDRDRGLAGGWLTAFVDPRYQAQRLGRATVLRAINAPELAGLAWTFSAWLGNLPSIEAYHVLGFRISHYTHDLHRWRRP